MRVARLVLDYLRLFLWPALIVFGVWKYRAEVRRLLAGIGRLFERSGVRRAKATGGLEIELEQVQEVKDSVEERTERALTTDDPVEREQLVRRVVEDATTLGRLQERIRRDLANTVGEEEELVNHYLQEAFVIALEQSWSAGQRSTLVRDVLSILTFDREQGRSAHETLRRLGTPRDLVTRGGGCPD